MQSDEGAHEDGAGLNLEILYADGQVHRRYLTAMGKATVFVGCRGPLRGLAEARCRFYGDAFAVCTEPNLRVAPGLRQFRRRHT